MGAGAWPDGETAALASAPGERTLPDPTQRAVYEQLYGLYRGLYPTLRPTFDALATVG